MMIIIQKKIFSKEIFISHKASEIKNNSWVNIYDLFLKSNNNFIWPRGLPLDEISVSKVKISKKNTNFFYNKEFVI